MGLCFIGKRKFSRFISQYIPDNVGVIKSIETDEIIGKHDGLHRYTIGQRITPINKQVSSSKPWYIAKKDPRENVVYAVEDFQSISSVSSVSFQAPGTDHPALFTKSFQTELPHWIHDIPPILKQTGVYQCDFRFQHKHRPLPVTVSLADNHTLHVSLPIPIRSICPGQVHLDHSSTKIIPSYLLVCCVL